MENPLSTLDCVTELPQALIDDLAIGTRTFDAIFAMHGEPDNVRDFVRESPVLERIVEERKKDIENSGEMVKHHARWGMEQTATAMMRKVSDPATPASVLSDYYKAFRETAYPKNQIDAGAGDSKFTITFNINPPKSQRVEKDITPEDDLSGLSDTPSYVHKMNAALEYTE